MGLGGARVLLTNELLQLQIKGHVCINTLGMRVRLPCRLADRRFANYCCKSYLGAGAHDEQNIRSQGVTWHADGSSTIDPVSRSPRKARVIDKGEH